MATQTPIEIATEHVRSAFQNQFLIPIRGFSAVTGITFGGCRNQIAQGTFPLPTVLQGARRFVTAPDLIEYLSAKFAAAHCGCDAPETAIHSMQKEEKRRPGRPQKYPKAKAMLALARKRADAGAP